VKRVGWIGLGHIGQPMAQRVLAAGFELTLWARRREAAAALLDAGASWADDPLALVRQVDVLCTCVGGPPDVSALHQQLMPQAAPGTLFIDHSTAAPATAVASSALASSHGLQLLDSPVTGGVAGAQRGTLTTFVGGDAAALERARPLLSSFAQRIVPGGAAGGGYRLKLLNQTLMAGSLMGLADGARLARAAGLDAATVKDALGSGSGASALFDNYLPRLMAGSGAATFSLGLLLKDLRLALDEAHALAVPAPLLQAAIDAVAAACSRHGDQAGVQMLATP
jgi:3-hydroxyisobutyrate dehydrogenase-like beta-hydroxyacid dehydrogenase